MKINMDKKKRAFLMSAEGRLVFEKEKIIIVFPLHFFISF